MHEILTKEQQHRSVSKKAAAIFLSITMTFIGSAFNEAKAQDNVNAIAATATATSSPYVFTGSPHFTVSDLFKLPKKLPPREFNCNLPKLEENSLATFIRKPENILGDDPSQASSRIPLITGMITSAFGYRKHPVRGRVRHHDGIDLAAKLGTPVMAPAAGVVVFAGFRNGYGMVVEIDHENGYTSLLAHHSAILVKVGDVVDTGTVIAKAGRTGVATGVHVHVEVRRNGSLVNPTAFLTQ
ncbi:M23 family peptidase [Xanthomonas phage Xoo-sp13]|nr:M23 family peptidase [Xanthomonas phage Xoo-sp13]